MDDRALVQAIADGEDAAASELFRRHRKAMRACALSVLRDPDDADDAVQTAMARAIAAIPRDRPRRLRPWLETIARNEALMLLRTRVPREALSPELPDVRSVEGAFALREEIAGLVVDLRDLPDRQRTALVLRHLYELSSRDIGELLGIRAGTARQAVLQARRSLVARAQARDQDCGDIRLLLAGDGRARRAVAVRAHLQTCAACRAAAPAGLPARIRTLLPLPEPMLPPLLIRLLSGPGTTMRTGGAAAACLCTFAIGLGIVDDDRRGDGRSPVARAPQTIAQAPEREAAQPRGADRTRRAATRLQRRAAQPRSNAVPAPGPSAPATSAPTTGDAATPTAAPAATQPGRAPFGVKETPLPVVGTGEDHRPFIEVVVLDQRVAEIGEPDTIVPPNAYPVDPENPPVDPELLP